MARPNVILIATLQLSKLLRTIFARLAGPLQNMIAFGTTGKDPVSSRHLRALNVFVTLVVLSTIFVIGQSLFRLGFAKHHALILWASFILFMWALTPLSNRFGEVVATTYFVGVSWIGFVVQGYIAGSSLGSHYFLLAAPAVSISLGSKRMLIAILLLFWALFGFYIVEFTFPSSSFEPVPRDFAELNLQYCLFGSSILLFWSIYYALYVGDRAEAALEREYERSEHLLLNLMPASIAARLKEKPEETIADHFDEVAILFADVVNFTPRASKLPAVEVVRFLNRVFTRFDRLAAIHCLEKIKTVGDAYMVAGGMPDRHQGYARRVAELALDMLDATRDLSEEIGEEIAIRIGIHIGPAVAGVIGTQKLFYDVWGDTVNTASRMESLGSAGRIQVTETAMQILADEYVFERRARVHVKGKGEMELYYLLARKAVGERDQPIPGP
ncbi:MULTISPECIES: adenylate/guanylate cyclase domain-containing protein [Mesorhizobium]|uniref:adenylate/guanylate cyclase domain-containing protein n=1 Tax=Mesorhizobium TaxID=68287 RepID=UPI001459FFB9|nr:MULTISPECIES: adenylate/guanylate cyclase domain-containing protein [Mesorhizobium]